jgi:methylated-DNA-[protein]-cysteine S-methyltransferase
MTTYSLSQKHVKTSPHQRKGTHISKKEPPTSSPCNVWSFDSPLGEISGVESGGKLSRLLFGRAPNFPNYEHKETPLLQKTSKQIGEYFSGKRKIFTLPLNLCGTHFQKAVWTILLTIPFGKTCSYKELAIMAGNPKAARAVGAANHHNPIAIIVPCHRVIGTNGSLVGYAAGLDTKRYLLELEKQQTATLK